MVSIQDDRISSILELFTKVDNSGGGDHVYARRRDGTFSPRYNRIARVRRMKYASIDEKIKDKDFSRLSLNQLKAANLVHD
jgi:hypothetical protein